MGVLEQELGGIIMYKYIRLVLFLALIIVGCDKDSGTEPVTIPTHDLALVGTWDLTTCKINGSVVSYQNFADCPVKIQFNAEGTGIVWKKDYGTACGCESFS